MEPSSDKDPVVVFSPSGKRGRFSEGTSILEAARILGVDIDSVCGGRSVCGRCQVSVVEGELSKHGIVSTSANLTETTQTELRYHKKQGLRDGYRLSCQAKLSGDVAIDVPASSQVHRQVVRKSFEAHDIEINPIVHTYVVSVSEPALDDPRGDLERLNEALQQEWQLDDLSCSRTVMESLQTTLRSADWLISVAVRESKEIIAIWPGVKERIYGVAIDVGSTTIAAHLCDLASGEVISDAGRMNPQIRYGEDLMSRISYIMMKPGGDRELTRTVRETVSELVQEVVDDAGLEVNDVAEITIVGNPIMQHLVLGLNPVNLGTAPFTLVTDAAVTVLAGDIGIEINPGGYAYVLPCVAGHVGADTAGVLLAEAPFEREEINLIVDVGTNAEIVLGNRDRLLAASSPTGPAFEGAQISSGQRAAPGAIERVRIDRETLEPRFKVIGCELWSDDPEFENQITESGISGICGSGIIELVAELYLAGVISSDGVIVDETPSRSKRIFRQERTFAYMLIDGEPGVSISQNDVRAIQLAKAALSAGIHLLMEKLKVEQVDRIRLAGAFGAHIDCKYAMVLGMLPDCDLAKVSSAGNAAGTGARIALLDQKSRSTIERQVRNIEKIETAIADQFQQHFVSAMAIPHIDDPFDELRKVVDLPVRTATASSASHKKRRRNR